MTFILVKQILSAYYMLGVVGLTSHYIQIKPLFTTSSTPRLGSESPSPVTWSIAPCSPVLGHSPASTQNTADRDPVRAQSDHVTSVLSTVSGARTASGMQQRFNICIE